MSRQHGSARQSDSCREDKLDPSHLVPDICTHTFQVEIHRNRREDSVMVKK